MSVGNAIPLAAGREEGAPVLSQTWSLLQARHESVHVLAKSVSL